MVGLFGRLGVFSLILYIIILGGAAAAGYQAADFYIENNLGSPFGNPSGERQSEIEVPEAEEDIINVLLMGIDSADTGFRSEVGGRTDSVMLLRYNPDTDDVGLVSIPRDTKVKLPDRGKDKLNHAHAYGGKEYLIKTVENFLDIPIHHYVAVNMTGFKNSIDILGGVDITVEQRMYHETVKNDEEVVVVDLHPGDELATGDKALQYVRWRGGPEADLGRIERQQKVIMAALDKLLRFDSITKINHLVEEVINNVETDFALSDLLSYAQAFYRIDWNDMETGTLPGESKKNELWYYIVDAEEAQAYIRDIIDIEPEDEEAEKEEEDIMDKEVVKDAEKDEEKDEN